MWLGSNAAILVGEDLADRTSADRTADISNRLIVVTTVVATVGCVYPGFLIGAVTVQVRNEFDVSAATYGWAMGTYFLAATFASVRMGSVRWPMV